MKYNQAKAIAEARDKTLTADEPGFDSKVFIAHQDGSTLNFTNAFFEIDEDYCFIYTEHHGFHVYNINDLSTYLMYRW